MKSSFDIKKCRCVRNLSTNLILHQGITNILNNVAEFIRVFGVAQELCYLAPLREREEVLEDVVQFANNQRLSGRWSTLGSEKLPFEDLPPRFLADFALWDWSAQRLGQRFNPRYQRLCLFATSYCSL
jgi:hypothetical protein